MIYLLLACLCSTLLVIVFKFFERFEIDTFQAIVFNYFVCVPTGALFLGHLPLAPLSDGAPWLGWAFLTGAIFIGGFYTAGMTVFHFGVTVAAIMQRMSLIISVPFAFWAFGEPSNTLKIIGLGCAFLAIIFTNIPPKQDPKNDTITSAPLTNKLLLLFPILALTVGGAAECVLQYVQAHKLSGPDDNAIYCIYLFGSAGVIGGIVLLGLFLKRKAKFAWRNVWGGIALGIPNYFSIFFILKAFEWQDKSVILPINNIGVVAVSALLGYFFFKEKKSLLNGAGILLAILAILLIAL